MSALRAALEDYLRIRRRLGFTMPQDGRLLEGLLEFLDRAGRSDVQVNAPAPPALLTRIFTEPEPGFPVEKERPDPTWPHG